MSSALVDLLLYEINNCFGLQCRELCRILLYDEWSTISYIKHELKLPSDQIFEFLQMLIDFNLVKVNLDGECVESYQFDVDAGVSFMMLDRYLVMINDEFGHLSKIIFDEFCKHGNLYLTQLLKKIEKHFPNNRNWVDNVIDEMNRLIRWKILEISPFHLIKNRSMNPHALIANVDQIKGELASMSETVRAGAKRPHEVTADNAWDAQYRINYSRMDALRVNDIVVRHAEHHVSREAGVVMKTLIDIYESGSQRCRDDPVSSSLLRSTVKLGDHRCLSDERFDECVFRLTTDSRVSFIDTSVGNAANGTALLRFDVARVVQQIAIERLRNAVDDLWGHNGLEVFSALLDNPYIEENEFRNSVLISKSKLDALLSQMLTKGFIARLVGDY